MSIFRDFHDFCLFRESVCYESKIEKVFVKDLILHLDFDPLKRTRMIMRDF